MALNEKAKCHHKCHLNALLLRFTREQIRRLHRLQVPGHDDFMMGNAIP
jgi:hypothetical protein